MLLNPTPITIGNALDAYGDPMQTRPLGRAALDILKACHMELANSTATATPLIKIRPSSGWSIINFKEAWEFRDVLFTLAIRDIKLRYKQTFLGIAWVILQPLIAGLIFTAIFGYFAKLPSEGTPYLIFVFAGLIPWRLFADSLQRGGNSLVTEAKLITKVYFPRFIVPLSSSIAALLDCLVSLVLIFVLMGIYGVAPSWNLLYVLPLLLLTTTLSAGMSLWLSALNVKYRDFMYAMPFLIQIWMYATPIVYSSEVVPQKWAWLFIANPMVGIIEGYRFAFLSTTTFTPNSIILSILWTFALFASGSVFFRRIERQFADKL